MASSRRVDVLVLGAGPAGVEAARAARDAGARALLVALGDEPALVELPDVELVSGTALRGIARTGTRVEGARLGGLLSARSVEAPVTIEATRDGAALAAGRVPFRVGPESRAQTGEREAPERVERPRTKPLDGECRRLVGVDLMTTRDLEPVDGATRPSLVTATVAAGIASAPGSAASVPFQVGYGCLVPAEVDGLLATGRAISTSRLASRVVEDEGLQRLLGRAAGVAGARAALQGYEVRDVALDPLQLELVRSGSTLFAYEDLAPDHPAFPAIQELAVAGESDVTEPVAFAPDRILDEGEAAQLAGRAVRAFRRPPAAMTALWRAGMTRAEFVLACAGAPEAGPPVDRQRSRAMQ